MSADAWKVCPRCAARGDLGYKGSEFREDYEVGLLEDETPPVVYVSYRGECQRCNLLLTFEERRPLVWDESTNQPTGFVTSKPWSAIPVRWFVQAKPGGDWYEVLATRAMHSNLQLVKLRIGNGEVETQRPREDQVTCRAGSLSNPIGDAVQALGEGVEILEDRP